MKFNIFSELSYEVFSPTTFIFNIHAASLPNQQICNESFLITPEINFTEFKLDNGDARFIKLYASKGIFFTLTYNTEVDVQHRIIDETALLQSIPIIEFNTEVLPYLFPSRHCQVDKLRKLSTKLFSQLPNDYSKVVAINDWIFNNIDYIT